MKVLKKNLMGEITYHYEGLVLHRTENEVTIEALFNRDDLPFMDIVLKRNDRFVETFFTDRWYNIFRIYDCQTGVFKGTYCNIAKPAEITADFISYVDLALDLWVSTDGIQTVLDEDELLQLGLEAPLHEKVYQSLRDLQQYLSPKSPPG